MQATSVRSVGIVDIPKVVKKRAQRVSKALRIVGALPRHIAFRVRAQGLNFRHQGGQLHGEPRTCPFPAVQCDAALVKFDYRSDEVKADPAADYPGGGAAAIVAFEYLLLLALRSADPMVFDHDHDLCTLLYRGHLDGAGVRRVLDRIRQ